MAELKNGCHVHRGRDGRADLPTSTNVPSHPTPISVLPPELLAHAIGFARDAYAFDAHSKIGNSPSNHTNTFSPVPQLDCNPVVASAQVCRSWRSLILNTASLWTSLHVDGAMEPSTCIKKTRGWSCRALGDVLSPMDTENENEWEDESIVASGLGGGPGIVDFTVNHLEQVTDGTLDTILRILTSSKFLSHFAASWSDPPMLPAKEQNQLESLFRHLITRASTSLLSLTISTTSHLRIHLSLPRLGNTFTSLRSLTLRSRPASSPGANNVYLIPRLFPQYNNEPDWPPLPLRQLTLVGPVWRLQFDDGTIASPELSVEDCPLLEELELGSTTPCMTWALLSSPKLRRLHLERQRDQRGEPEPVMTPTLEHVTLSSCDEAFVERVRASCEQHKVPLRWAQRRQAIGDTGQYVKHQHWEAVKEELE